MIMATITMITMVVTKMSMITIGNFRLEYKYDYEYEFSVLSTRTLKNVDLET